jgi:predicted glycoside hydrolase/deacetylase ChbG (UPF0249 family)
MVPAGRVDPAPAPTGQSGFLIVNADDWGRNAPTTDMIFDCAERGAVSSVSAMVFMEDSERAAEIAAGHGIDTGLHLNFTAPFTASSRPSRLAEHQRRVTAHLRRHRWAQTVFHPGLVRSFQYVVSSQIDEYRRVYDTEPRRLDGHHHMHLCANVLLQRLLPAGTLVRRNFSFQAGEKGAHNRAYRRCVDAILARRHQLTDYLFNLVPLENGDRLQRIVALGRTCIVELETHPVAPEEYEFLRGGEIFRRIRDTRIAPASLVHDVRGTRGHQ